VLYFTGQDSPQDPYFPLKGFKILPFYCSVYSIGEGSWRLLDPTPATLFGKKGRSGTSGAKSRNFADLIPCLRDWLRKPQITDGVQWPESTT